MGPHRWLTFLDQTPAQRAVEKLQEPYRLLQHGHLNIVECGPMRPGELNFAPYTYKPWKVPFGTIDKFWEDAVAKTKKKTEPYVYVRPEGKQFIQLRICCDNRNTSGMVHASPLGGDAHTPVGFKRCATFWGV